MFERWKKLKLEIQKLDELIEILENGKHGAGLNPVGVVDGGWTSDRTGSAGAKLADLKVERYEKNQELHRLALEIAAAIEECDELSCLERAALGRYYGEEMGYKGIAHSLGKSLEAAKKLVLRGRNKIGKKRRLKILKKFVKGVDKMSPKV